MHGVDFVLARWSSKPALVKKRFSAFIDGSLHLEPYLRRRGLDTVLIGGTPRISMDHGKLKMKRST